jgi:uncharacterized protein involved in outer membrane biogenesis
MVIWLRRLAWGVGAVMLLWVIAWLALPPLIKWQLPLRASEALGREVTIGDVSVRPWSLELAVNDLVIAGPPGSEPLLRVQRVHFDLAASGLFRRTPVIEAIEIDAPRLRVARTSAGHYDIDDLITRFTPRADAPPKEPARFALYNLQVRDAQLRFDDRPVSRVHQVDALQLALPFLSNLPAEVELKVEPRLSFKLDGTPFDSGAQATPFAQSRSGALTLKMADLNLVPYLGYLPASLPLRVTRGSISADLSLQFAAPQGGTPSVALKGAVGAKDLALTDVAGQPLLDWQRLQLGLRDVQPLGQKLAFESLRIDGLQVHATRDAAGQVNLLQLAAAKAEKKGDGVPAAKPVPAAPAPQATASGTSGVAAAVAPATGWQLSLVSLDLADARVLWNDAAVTPAAVLQIDGLTIGAKQVQWPVTEPIAVALNGALRAQAAGAPTLAEFSATGPVTDRSAKLELKLGGLSLAALAPYVGQALVPRVEGQLVAQAQLDWSGAADAPRLRLHIDSATLDALKVREGSASATQNSVSLQQLALLDVQVDVLARSLALGSVRIVQPVVALAREADGRTITQRWRAGASQPAPAPATVSASGPEQTPWRVQLKDLLLEGGQVTFADAQARRAARASTGTNDRDRADGTEPLRVEVSSIRLAVQDMEWQGERSTAPANVQLNARIGAARRDKTQLAGVLGYKGRIGLYPMLVNGNLRVERFPVHLFAPYFADKAQLTLLRAEAGYIGNVALRQLPGGLDLSASGDMLLGDVHVATLPDAAAPASADNTDELLSWQALALKGVKVTLKPKLRPQVEVGSIALSDFYSRLVITEEGRFNLRDVAAAPAGAASAGAATSAAPEAASAASASATTATATATATADAGGPGSGLPLDLKLGVSTLTNGRIDFTDRLIKPGYSAALTELNGELGAFTSGSREMATLALRGRAAGTALLEISGQLNPTAKPLALDIRAKATDLELAPLSPYAGKYAGYAIERGKLSMEVAYKIDPDGKLTASNQIVLNQLTFGDKIESKDATKLPVQLAVALLKDRNGVIDINLPVSGSINDPKFSVGAIIWKVIGNLLTKAFTAPFALLAGGGGEDLSLVEFQPGTAHVTAGGAGAVDKVAKALTDRPSLTMTVTGAADPVSEREAYQSAAIETRLLAERRRELLRSGAPASAASAPEALSPDERTRLLKQVYKDTDIPNKPRNAIGFAKEIPAPEMEALLKTRTVVSTEAMRELALQRGIAVRDTLIAKGLPSQRLFLAAPKLRVSSEDDAAWTPRVQLSLAVN